MDKINNSTLVSGVVHSVVKKLARSPQRAFGSALRIQLWLSFFLFFMSLALLAWPHSLQAAPPAQAPDTAPRVSSGRALWSENCAPCHGPTGQGDGPTAQAIENPVPNLTDPTLARQRSPLDNFDVIKNGRMDRFMPPWGNRLNDAQIWDLTAFVWNLAVPPENLAVGEQIYLEQCAACHGDDGTGNTPDAPAEMIDFTNLAVMTQRSQASLQAGFAASAAHDELDELSETQFWQTLDYIRTFSVALPQSNGILTGQVLNGTNNQPQGNVEVTLLAFEGDSPVNTFTTQADENGRYRFENLPTDHSIFYMVEGTYRDISYRSEPVPFVPDSSEAVANLEVYEPTTNGEAIRLDRLNYLISFAPGSLDVIQLFVLSNSSNQTYIGEDGQTFSFKLPTAAADVIFQGDAGSYITPTENGYVSTEPVLPGEEGLLLAALYNVPFEGDSLSVDVPLPADVASMNVLMQDIGAELSSDQLQFIEAREVQGNRFSIYGGADLPQGTTLTLALTGLNELEFTPVPGNVPPGATVAPGNAVDQNLLRWGILGLGGTIILLTILLYPRLRTQWGYDAAPPDQDPQIRRQKLLLLLARLDDAFEAGELDGQVYRQARGRYKIELAGIMKE